MLNIRYGIAGNRTIGAHAPVTVEPARSEDSKQDLIFRSALVLQRPVMDPCLAVGFLPLSSGGLRVGQLVTMKWRIEWLKDFDENSISENNVSEKTFQLSLKMIDEFRTPSVPLLLKV